MALAPPFAEMLGVAPGKPKDVEDWLVGEVPKSPPEKLKRFSTSPAPW